MAIGKYKKWLEPESLTLLEGWAREGLIDKELAKKIGISESTLYSWKKEYSEISEALKKGKEVTDFEVEKSLLKRAVGFEYEEVTTEDKTNFDGKIIERHKRVTRKYVPPDTGAAMAWLKNRRPDKWRDRKDAEKTVDLLEENAITINVIRVPIERDD